MSLLGFDALGRLALGQLPRIGLTNTVLTAGTASCTVAAQMKKAQEQQASGALNAQQKLPGGPL